MRSMANRAMKAIRRDAAAMANDERGAMYAWRGPCNEIGGEIVDFKAALASGAFGILLVSRRKSLSITLIVAIRKPSTP